MAPTPDAAEQLDTPQSSPDDALPHETTTITTNSKTVLRKLYLSHTLSTWNARTFEFSAVIFLASIFPSTLFYASCYALFRSLAAFLFSSAVGHQVDTRERLSVVRHSIIWQRVSVAASCGILLLLLRSAPGGSAWTRVLGFVGLVLLAGVEKLAFVGNTVAVERDWVVVVAEGLGGKGEVERGELNGVMRRIDLVCKLVAPVGISLVEGWWGAEGAVWVVFGQNALSVVFVSLGSFLCSCPWLMVGQWILTDCGCRNTLPLRMFMLLFQDSRAEKGNPWLLLKMSKDDAHHHRTTLTMATHLSKTPSNNGKATSRTPPASPPSPSHSSTSQSSASAPN